MRASSETLDLDNHEITAARWFEVKPLLAAWKAAGSPATKRSVAMEAAVGDAQGRNKVCHFRNKVTI